ncbi:MAG: HAD-IIIA family hydrolase [Desulfobacterales bacterium]|nr:HAD-IIIA family hydrolase [Desulfobacterales bacterium]
MIANTEQVKNIKLVLFDVDGVLTDGSIFISEQGEIFKQFNVKDGLAIELLHRYGITTGVISGKTSPALTRRCQQLGFNIVITGCKNKLPKLHEIASVRGISFENIAFCGDDVLDLPVMNVCGLSISPADAHSLVLDSADWVMTLEGGRGMVREFADKLLTLQLGISLCEIYNPLMDKIKSDDVSGIHQ